MNTLMENLLRYVEEKVDSIVREKEENHIRPLIATKREIMLSLSDDVLECMREIHNSGKYKGTNTLNEPALLKIEKYDRDKKQ